MFDSINILTNLYPTMIEEVAENVDLMVEYGPSRLVNQFIPPPTRRQVCWATPEAFQCRIRPNSKALFVFTEWCAHNLHWQLCVMARRE
jgi:hypothetical protein